MTLNAEQRAKLLARATELRTEVSALTSERDAAFRENADAVADAKLIAEVVGLERQAEEAKRQRDAAVNSTDDALLIMQQAIEQQVDIAASQNAGGSEPDRTGQDGETEKVDVSEAASTKEDAEERVGEEAAAPAEAVAVPQQQDASTPATAAPTKIKGGNR